MKTRNYLAAAATVMTAVAFISCNANDKIVDNENQPVRFMANIDQIVAKANGTRASGATWANGDAIGVFMLDASNNLINGAANKQYTTSGDGAFKAVTGDEIYFPVNGSAVNFIAYYPYNGSNTTLGYIDVVIGDQTDQPDFDLLYVKADGFTKAPKDPVDLTFEHKLAKLVLNIKNGDDISADLESITGVTITGMYTQASFNLTSGVFEGTPDGQVSITTLKVGYYPDGIGEGDNAIPGPLVQFDAIILPINYSRLNDIVVEIESGNDIFTWDAGRIEFTGGNEYTYTITLSQREISATGSIKPWVSSSNVNVDAY